MPLTEKQTRYKYAREFETDKAVDYSFTDDIPAGIYPGFSINLSQLNT